MPESFSPMKAEKVNQILLRSNFSDLNPETMLAAFEAEGIRSLEDFAERLTTALRDPKGLPQRVPYEGLFAEPTPPQVLATIEHPVPRVPFVVDGVVHDPKDIVRYNGQELSFIPQEGGTELLVLTDKSVWAPLTRTALLSRAVARGLTADSHRLGAQSVGGPSDTTLLNLAMPDNTDGVPRAMGPPVPDPAPPWTAGFTDINFGGHGLSFQPGESRRNLLEVGVWPWLDDFNDKFSSLHRTTSLCTAFDHIHFQGDLLWCGPSHHNFLNLIDLGWNDRISSFINGG